MLVEHANIVSAIRERDPGKAKSELIIHLGNLAADIRPVFAEE